MPQSSARVEMVNTAGAGLLLGSALCVILPEGFEAVHEAQEHAQNASAVTPEWAANLMLLLGFWCMMALDTLSHTLAPHSTHELQRESSTSPIVSCHDSSPSHYGYDCEALHEEAQLLQRPSSVAGTAANQRQKAHDSHGLSPYRGSAVSTSAVTPNGVASSAALLQDPADRVLLGLVVHAAADGLAVGASSLSTQPLVVLSVAAAMVVHKGPVAVGLTSYLKTAQWTMGRIQKGLLVFAATSPIMALLTYLTLSHAPGMTSDGSVALCVLFSGGTVLYAACIHILPALMGPHGSLSSSKLLALTVGMVLPMVLSLTIHHSHSHA
eukprot:jgi/Chrzof1/1516/Cz10g10210.t1